MILVRQIPNKGMVHNCSFFLKNEHPYYVPNYGHYLYFPYSLFCSRALKFKILGSKSLANQIHLNTYGLPNIPRSVLFQPFQPMMGKLWPQRRRIGSLYHRISIHPLLGHLWESCSKTTSRLKMEPAFGSLKRTFSEGEGPSETLNKLICDLWASYLCCGHLVGILLVGILLSHWVKAIVVAKLRHNSTQTK